MQSNTTLKAAAISALLASAAFATPATAGGFGFEYRAHELQTAQGRSEMLSRLDREADAFCGAHDYAPGARRRVESCAARMVGTTLDAINDRRLTALWVGELGEIASR